MLLAKPLFLLLSAIALLIGCDSDNVYVGPATGESALDFPLPDKIRTSQAVDFSQVTGVANVNGRTYPMEPFGNRYRVIIPNVPANSDVTINLVFSERLPNGRDLDLAATDLQPYQIGATDRTIQINADEYNYDFDDDGDQISNIAERDNGTDPLVPENGGTRTILLQFNLPLRIEDPAITRVITFMADVARPRSPPFNSSFVQVSGVIANGITFDIDVILNQFYQGQNVTIARAKTQVQAGSNDLTVTLSDEEFDFSFDDDGDGIFNIDELQNGTY